jgi:hypothetical protein
MSKMLKKYLICFGIFLSGGGICSPVLASDLDFDFIRTEESPGFFALQIYPSEDLKPIPVKYIFVRNYPENLAEKFRILEDFLREEAFVVIDWEQREKFLAEANQAVRWVYLGERERITDLAFMPVDTSEEAMLKSLEIFLQRELDPVYLRNIRIEMGGNVQQLLPETVAYIGRNPEIFVGKFSEERLTRMRIFAETLEGERFVEVPLDFSIKANHPLRENLGEIWEEYFSFSSRRSSIIYDKRWVKFFPYILAFFGIVFIFLAIFSWGRRSPLVGRQGVRERNYEQPPSVPTSGEESGVPQKRVFEMPPPPKYWDHSPTQRSFEAGEDREFWERRG